MYFSDSPKQFRSILLKELHFHAINQENYICYQKPGFPEGGVYHLYQREGFYDFGIANYTIDHAFSIQFDNLEPVLRFGIIYDGVTKFQPKHQPASSFMPSPFLVLEKEIRGKQSWEAGQHFHGAEVTLYPAFLKKLAGQFSDFHPLDYFIENHTYHYLPVDIMTVLYRMLYLDRMDSLNALHLEAAILECMGVIKERKKANGTNTFLGQIDYGSVKIGKKRKLRFTAEDFKTIQKAHDILTEQFANPPTIEALSRELLINPQKLKAGFLYYYHMTIGEYAASLKMALAATLLCTTDKSVAEIAAEVGYGYSANFSKKFRQTYSCTPLKYRMREKR